MRIDYMMHDWTRVHDETAWLLRSRTEKNAHCIAVAEQSPFTFTITFQILALDTTWWNSVVASYATDVVTKTSDNFVRLRSPDGH